jgi:outer membrane protein assembly factor BamD
VTFRIAKSYYSRLPDTVDRDLTAADSAIRFFDEVIRRYPDSNYAKEAKELRKTALNKLAAKEYYVAQFYFHRSQFDSALGRYENLVKIYPEDELVAKAHYGAAVSAAKLGQRNRSRIHVEALLEKFPGTPEAKKAKVGLE